MSAHPAAPSITWEDIVFLCLIASAVWAAVKRAARAISRGGRRRGEVRHRRRLELALARSGRLYPGASPHRAPLAEMAVPAAVTASPPGAKPVTATPGRCRHERIIPAIGADGDVKRWLCANYERCDAEFPPDTALYESPWAGDAPGNAQGEPA